MGTTAYGGKGQGKGKGSREGRLGQGGRGRSQGGERPMGTTACGGKGSMGRAANGDRPVGEASCRREQNTMPNPQMDIPTPTTLQHDNIHICNHELTRSTQVSAWTHLANGDGYSPPLCGQTQSSEKRDSLGAPLAQPPRERKSVSGGKDRAGRERARALGGERPMGTTTFTGKGFKERIRVSGERPMGAASFRQVSMQVSCQTPQRISFQPTVNHCNARICNQGVSNMHKFPEMCP